jgi:starch synthase
VEEGISLVQAEAMACGCPVVATTNTGSEDLFEDGVQGFIVPIRSPEAIADRMQRLSADLGLRQHMSAACLERVKKMGGWDRYGDIVTALMRGLVEAKQEATVTASPSGADPFASVSRPPSSCL